MELRKIKIIYKKYCYYCKKYFYRKSSMSNKVICKKCRSEGSIK